MAVRDIFVRLLADHRQFEVGFAEANKKLKDFEGQAGKTSGAARLLGGTLERYLGPAALGALATGLAAGAWQLGKLGAQSAAVTRNLEAFAGGAEEAALYLNAVRQASGGTVDRMTASAAASRMLQMGIADSTDAMRLYVEGAVRLGDQTQNSSQRINEMVQLLKNLNVNMLDNFGLSRQVVMARTRELQATEGLTREQGMLRAIQEEISRQLGVLGPQADDDSRAFDQLNTALSDLKVTAGEQLAPALADVAREANNMLIALGESGAFSATIADLGVQAAGAGASFAELASAARYAKAQFIFGEDAKLFWFDVSKFVKLSAEDLMSLGHQAGASAGQIAALAKVMGIDLPAQFAAATSATGGWMAEIGGLPGVLNEVSGAQEAAADATEAHTKALREQISAANDTKAALARLFGHLAEKSKRGFGIDLQTQMATWEKNVDPLANKFEESQAEVLEKVRDEHRYTAAEVHDAWKDALGDLRNTVRGALRPTAVTALDMDLSAEGAYKEKWDESARQLRAIAQRGFAELDAHPDWAEMLKIPPEVLNAGEAALRDWAGRTANAVQNLERPDLINMDAALDAVQAEINRQAAQELSLDLIVEAAVARGIVTGEDAKQQVAQALGLSDEPVPIPVTLVAPEEGGAGAAGGIGQDLAGTVLGSFELAVSTTDMAPTVVAAMRKSVTKNQKALAGVGELMWDVMRDSMYAAMHDSAFVQRFVQIMVPFMEAALRRRDFWE